MTIQAYVKKNYDKLPKSNFNSNELVVVWEINHDDQGYGNHSYDGIGVDRNGNVHWCYSSGCSCNGYCETTHKKDLKDFVVNGYDLSKIDWKEVNFDAIQVSFSDY